MVLWFEDDDEAVGGVAKGCFEFDLGFLERFLLGRDNLFYFADDQIAGDKFTWFGKDIISNDDGRETRDINYLRSVGGVFVLTFLTGGSVDGNSTGTITIERIDINDRAFDIGDGTEKDFSQD